MSKHFGSCALIIIFSLIHYLAGFDGFGEVMAPANPSKQQVPQPKKEDKLIKDDIDASMALLAGNLNIGRDGNQMKK